MSPKEVTGDIHQKARECLKKDVRAMLLHCANVGRRGQTPSFFGRGEVRAVEEPELYLWRGRKRGRAEAAGERKNRSGRGRSGLFLL